MDSLLLGDWLRQLDYFYEVEEFIDEDKVVFAKLCMCGEFSVKDRFYTVNYWKEQQQPWQYLR
jgi:hypothetical protein